ncbi:MAG: BON domain-containing protein [Rhodopirellula sp.]|nr:BON domain-containing protein [Rhodopirellula sp.]
MQPAKHYVADKAIIQKVSQRLSRAGMSTTCQLTVLCQHGDVTLSGTLQFEHQRRAALAATRAVEGVHRVVDQMRVLPPPNVRFPNKLAGKGEENGSPKPSDRNGAPASGIPQS